MFMLAALLWPVAAATRPAAKPSSEQQPVAGVLLVAKRDMMSPGFTQTVLLGFHHDASGSAGVILNRRTPHTLKDVFPEFDQDEAGRHALQFGGPVAPKSYLMLMRKEDLSGVQTVPGGITLSTDTDVLRALLERKKSPDDLRVFIGYAGWAGGQLENELARGAWHLTPATDELVFGNVSGMWERLIDKLDPPGVRVEASHRPQLADFNFPRTDW